MRNLRLLTIILAFSALLAFTACNDGSGESASTTGTSPQEETEATTPAQEVTTEETTEVTTPAQEETTKATTSELGKRSNPVPFGTTATFNNNYYADGGGEIEATISVTFSNLMRGEEAYDFLLEQNDYNEAAPEGYEWVVFDITLRLDKGSADDAYSVTPSLNVFSSSGSEVEQIEYASFETGQDFGWIDISEGGEATGKVGKLIPVGDDVLIEFSEWNASVFFSLQ